MSILTTVFTWNYKVTMKKILCCHIVCLSIVCFGASAFSMTIGGDEPSDTGEERIVKKTDSIVYLLGWKGNKIHTTVGTFVTSDVTVYNETGVPQNELGDEKTLPHVEFVKNGNRIVEIHLLP